LGKTRIYYDGSIGTGAALTLSSAASNHLIRVLRSKTGSTVTVFNGKGGEYSALLLDENPKAAQVEITGFIDSDRESPLRITLVQGLSRGEHMDTTIQKATELGVSEIVPVICERSASINKERAAKKRARWHQIAISACEQSGRNVLPFVQETTAFDHAINAVAAGTKLVMDPAATERIRSIEPGEPSACILCGPEGGLSDQEINLAVTLGFRRINTGPRVLRTETAGPALITALQTLWGDMG
jgi:16S rRNA (uracil1498-N3)-methyltransferase